MCGRFDCGFRFVLLVSFLFALVPVVHAVDWDDAGNSTSKLWDDNGNWSPDGDPDGTAVRIGNLANAANDVTLVDRAYSINSLEVTNGADVVNSTTSGATDDFEVIVNGLTSVSGAGSSIIIYGGDPDGLDTNTLTVSAGGSIVLNSTSASGTAVVEVDDGLFNIGTTGTLIGTGRVDLEDSLAGITTLLRNSGTITANTNSFFIGVAPAAGTLQITASNADARFDWDGLLFGSATLQANGNQTLDIDVAPSDAFSGTIDLFTGSTIDIADGWSLDTGTINANTAAYGLIIGGTDPNPGAPATIDGANWTMTGGTIDIPDSWDSLQLESQLTASGGTIENSGTMIFNNATNIQSGVDFNMNGTAASLVVNATVNIDVADFNLDGAGAADNVTTINTGGNLDLDLGAGADEGFNHTINMFGGELDVTTVDNDWSLETTGNLNAAGNATSTVNGETLAIRGDVNVSDDSVLNINAQTEYKSTANVVIKAGSTLNHGTVSYEGGSYSGDGIFRKGNATILSDTTWDVAIVDMDDGDTTIDDGATLTVNADQIDSTGDGIDRDVTIADTGVLDINLSGGAEVVFDSPNGQLTYNGNNTVSTFLTGSDIVMNGTMDVNGRGRSDSRLTIGGTVNINTANQYLHLRGGDLISTNRIEGGTINGPGAVAVGVSDALVGFDIINAPVRFLGNSSRVTADDGILTINGGFIGAVGGSIGTDDADGILDVTTPWNSNSALGVRMNGGELRGALLTNDGNVQGFGTIVAQVDNNTVLRAQGGVLTVFDQAPDRLDGTTDMGLLHADAGNFVVEYAADKGVSFQGTVQVDGGLSFFADQAVWTFQPASTLDLNGGTFRSNRTTILGGTLEADSTSRIENSSLFRFASTSSSTVNGDLLLGSNAEIESGATFAGGGSLINIPTRTLTIEDGAAVDILVENDGRLVLGSAAGQTTGLDFQQSSTGVWDVEIGGTGLNDFDRMNLTGAASLDGSLDLSLIMGFAPSLGETFNILSATGGVAGAFASVSQPGAMPAGLMFDVNYLGSIVQLEVVNASMLVDGDFNDDGNYDCSDIDDLVLEIAAGSNGAAFDLTGDGNVDLDDRNEWLVQGGAENLVSGNAYLIGDLDLDGSVGSADLGMLVNNFGASSGISYCGGDINADSNVNSDDLGLLLNNFGNSAAAAIAVPEPDTMPLLLLACMGLWHRRRVEGRRAKS